MDLTCSEPPGHAAHWTGRAMAKAVDVNLRANDPEFDRREEPNPGARPRAIGLAAQARKMRGDDP
jgi:hypothetical protein